MQFKQNSRNAEPSASSDVGRVVPDVGADKMLSRQAHGLSPRVAVYARYSTDGQKETSIDDQIRACEEKAKHVGLEVDKSLIFTDEAVTGAAKATHKREKYRELRAGVRNGDIDVIICDQTCRLARSAKESLDFFEEVRDHNVRLLTADGFDSAQPTAQLLFGMKSVFSEFFLDETRHRVRRGVLGQFERGSMVTAVPYGYQVDDQRSKEESRCVWSVHPEHADIVREIFRARKAGMSFSQIGAILNGRRVPTPRDKNSEKGFFWRANAIWRILRNPIYKGVYVVNFSGKNAEENARSYRLMKELALVSEEEWDACQSLGKQSVPLPDGKASQNSQRSAVRGGYGGGKHALSGVIGCGVCGVPLSCHRGASDNGSMHCIQCEHATNVGVPGRQPLYVSIKGVRLMLRWLLEKVISGDAVKRYQDCLRERLAGGRESELLIARQELSRVERARERIGRLLGQLGDDDPVLEREFVKAHEDALVLTGRVRDLEAGLRELNHDAIQKQLEIDLSDVVDAFLSDQQTPERTRALLNRIFPSIVLKGKANRFTAIFRVEVKPGAILAEATSTLDLVSSNEVIWLQLQTSGAKHAVWTVVEIDAPEERAVELVVEEPLPA